MTTNTKLSRLTALETIRERVFAGDYDAALTLANAVSQPSGVIDYWRGICLTGLGADRALEAKAVLKTALGRGYSGALGAFAVAERLLGESRAYLRDLHPEEYSGFDAFDRAALLREIGIATEEAGDLSTATAYLETAWNTAKAGPHAAVQLSFIGQVLGTMLKRHGYDQRAQTVLSEALKHTSRTRHVPILYLRSQVNLELGQLEAVESDLAEMTMFIPTSPELPPLVKFAEAQLARARGENLPLALALYEQAGELGRLAETETEFFGLFGACSVQLERNVITTVLKQRQIYDSEIVEVGAEVYHSQLIDLAGTQRLQAFADLREALILLLRFDDRAVRVAMNAVNAFRALQHRREEGWALLTLAEVHLFREQGEINPDALEALEQALEIASELGAVVFARELRLLPRVRMYLSSEVGKNIRGLLI
jgi:tetratricopeptide (TPR) repeat protein